MFQTRTLPQTINFSILMEKEQQINIRVAREDDLKGIRKLIITRDAEFYPDAFRFCIMRSLTTQVS